MARSKSRPSQTPDSLDEFESWGEGALQWVSENARIVLGASAAMLVLAGAWGFWATAGREQQSKSAAALAEVQEAYMAAMGASPGAITVPELANPAAAANIRSEFIERYREVGDANRGTAAGAFARFEEGNLAAADGASEAAIEVWRAGIAGVPAGWPVTGLLQRRIGQELEVDGSWLAAAEAYEAAAAVPGFAFAPWALADAARCHLRAEQPERALTLLDQLEAEHPNVQLPEYLIVQFREVRAAQLR